MSQQRLQALNVTILVHKHNYMNHYYYHLLQFRVNHSSELESNFHFCLIQPTKKIKKIAKTLCILQGFILQQLPGPLANAMRNSHTYRRTTPNTSNSWSTLVPPLPADHEIECFVEVVRVSYIIIIKLSLRFFKHTCKF